MNDRYAEGLCIAAGLVAASFPARDFHHREHVLATACLLLSQPAVDWSRQLPGIIRRYNLVMGGANSAEAGYHETLTQYFLQEIRHFLDAHARLSPAAACAALLDSPLAGRDYALRAYSPERLFSRDARREYLAPDRIPAHAPAPA